MNRTAQALGLGMLVAGLLPLYRLLADGEGPAAETFRAWGDGYAGNALAATLAVALLAALLLPLGRRMGDVGQPIGVRASPGRDVLAWGAAAAGAAAAWAFSAWALRGGPLLVDGVAQLVQARLFAAGRIALPTEVPAEFFHFQYLAPSRLGWTSQYPPGHAVLLAAGVVVGAAGLVGPLLHGATAWLGVRVGRRLLPEAGPGLWAGAALLALSPLALAPAGAYMAHTSAAFLALAAVAAALRWGDGDDTWFAALAGSALGALACVRPYTALYAGVVVAVAPWLLRPGRKPRAARVYAGALVLGAAPWVAALLAYNTVLFGGPAAFGYEVAQGPAHALGFHTDPWGAAYTLGAALAYAATELQAAGVELAGAPLPFTPVIGAALLAGAAAGREVLLLSAWALAPAVAGLFYWHHDLSMGPRLLSDAAPAWALLGGWATGRLVGAGRWASYRRSLALAAAVLAAGGIPIRLAAYRGRAPEPEPREARAAGGPLVFVHGSWEGRLGARLAARGVREDVLRRILGAYSSCEVQRYLDETEARREPASVPPDPAGDAALPDRDVVERRMPSGSVVHTYAGEELTPSCRTEAASDFRGLVGLPDLVWRGDIPGAERGGPLYVRDMGPERNGRLIRTYAGRTPWLLGRTEPGGRPTLLPYDEGAALWWDDDGGPP